jgi:four helix bundle protein
VKTKFISVGDFKDLKVYQKAYQLAKDIFLVTQKFPMEEKFSLTNQIRRSSRSVCVNLAEAYRKRRYKAHFVSKLSDAETENTETGVWLDFSMDFNYITKVEFEDLTARNNEVGKILFFMINNPDKFL